MANFDEVYYCGACKRQQQASEGIKCKICGRTTVSWNLTTQNERPAKKSWDFVHNKPEHREKPKHKRR